MQAPACATSVITLRLSGLGTPSVGKQSLSLPCSQCEHESDPPFLSQGENHLLYEREQKLKERERMLSVSQSNLQTITDHQARQQVAAVQQVPALGFELALIFRWGLFVCSDGMPELKP